MRPHIPGEDWIRYRSAREQLTTASILHENDSYLNIGGLLYTFISLKEPPDATFPGILRELISLDVPIIINVQVTIPDQTKVLKSYQSRLRKMQAAQRDTHGGFRINVEAQVAMEWTRGELGQAERRFLEQLPLTYEENARLYVHADASDPKRWRYVRSLRSSAIVSVLLIAP